MSRIRIVLGALLVFVQSASAQLIISEFMASNDLAHADFQGDFPDWIEIHNQGASLVDMGGMHLTDELGDFEKWEFPSPTWIAPGGHVVVFASDKDIAVSGQELHTNFKLGAGGEFLALIDTSGQTVVSAFAPLYPPQHTDVSYGVSWNPTPGATRGFFLNPTPGAANGVAGAAVADVQPTPALPGDTDDIVVEAEIVDPPGIATATATLHYRVSFSSELTLAMVDDGTGPDVTANDGVWTALIPAAASGPGNMVRWRVTTTDAGGGPPARLPLYNVPTKAPRYFGVVVDDPGVTSTLGILHWFVQNTSQVDTFTGTRGAVWWNGRFYDNVFCRIRGNSSTSWPKKNYKLDFNKGFHLAWLPNGTPVEEINLNSTWSDKSYLRRLLSWETYRDAGVTGSLAEPVRVERNGSFFSVAIFVEQPDEELLERNGLDGEGALYKMYNQCTSATQGVEKKTRQWEGHADLQALVTAVNTLSGTTLENWLFDNTDVPAIVSYLAATVLMHDNDHVHKNYYLYRDSDGDEEWRFIPWDKDLTFGRNFTLGGGVLNDSMWSSHPIQSHPLFGDQAHPKVDGFWNRLIDAFYQRPRLVQMTMRRLRTLMDEQLQAPNTPAGQLHYEGRIASLVGTMIIDVLSDQAAWGVPSWGSPTYDFATAITQLQNNYVTPRRNHLYNVHAGTGGIIPAAETVHDVRFGALERAVTGAATGEEYLEVRNCGAESTDLSGWIVAGGIVFAFPPGTVLPPGESLYVAADAKAFRARTSGPSGGQGLLVIGPFAGDLEFSDDLVLLNDTGTLMDQISASFGHELLTTGVGDAVLNVEGAAPGSEIYMLISVQTSGPLGCGPLWGLGLDALQAFWMPVGTHPFHVTADANGDYTFVAPPGSIPSGFTVDTRALNLDLATLSLKTSVPERTTF